MEYFLVVLISVFLAIFYLNYQDIMMNQGEDLVPGPHISAHENFWSQEARQTADPAPLTEELVQQVESVLGYKLPQAYIDICKVQNGGLPRLNWVSCDHIDPELPYVDISRISGIGFGQFSLLGPYGYHQNVGDDRYPNVGIFFATSLRDDVDGFVLDYSRVGAQGEPEVSTYCAESDSFLRIAPDFATFLTFLRPTNNYPDE